MRLESCGAKQATMESVKYSKTKEVEVEGRFLQWFYDDGLTTSSPGASVFDASRIPPAFPYSSNFAISPFVLQKMARTKTAKSKQVF